MNTNLTCVSCFYQVKNKHDTKYNTWFEKTLSVNCPYIFFSDSSGIHFIKQFRKDLPTFYVITELEDFYTYQYKDSIKTHPVHCPSAELNMIWNEKLFFVQKASKMNPFHSEFFQWIDAGICTYRNHAPPRTEYPDKNKLLTLPKNKFIYSSSEKYNENLVNFDNYYHHIAGTSYILHILLIDEFIDIYKVYLEKLMNKYNLYTDQIILTHIFKDYPDLFFKLCDGYGEVVPKMY
jgi:hypothetical protein